MRIFWFFTTGFVESLFILGVMLTETAARETLEQVIKEALSRAGKNLSAVLAICLGVSGVNHPSDQERVLNWIRYHVLSNLINPNLLLTFL